MSDSDEIWMGMFHIILLPGNEVMDVKSGKGGYTNAVAYASSAVEFCDKARPYIESCGLKVTRVEKIARLKSVLEKKEIEPVLMKAVELLQRGNDVGLGTLFTYPPA